MARSISQADQQLLDELGERDLRVSSAQLERWRAAGLLPKAERTWLGRGRGSTSKYPPVAVEIAAVLAMLGGQGVPLHRGVLGLFFARLPVPLDRLREAIRVVIDSFASEFNLVPTLMLGLSALSGEGDAPARRKLSPQALAAAENVAANGVNDVGSGQVVDALAELWAGPITVDKERLTKQLLERELAGEPLATATAAQGVDAAVALAELPIEALESLRVDAMALISARSSRADAAGILATTHPEVLLVAMCMWHVIGTTGAASGWATPRLTGTVSTSASIQEVGSPDIPGSLTVERPEV